MSLKNLVLWVLIVLLLVALFNIFQGSSPSAQTQQRTYSDVLSLAETGQIDSVVIDSRRDRVDGQLVGGEAFYAFTPDGAPGLIATLRDSGVEISAAPPNQGGTAFWQILISWFPMLLLIGVWIFFMRQMQSGGRGAMGFGKSKAKLLTERQGRVTFQDVAGVDEAKEELQEIVEFLRGRGDAETAAVLLEEAHPDASVAGVHHQPEDSARCRHRPQRDEPGTRVGEMVEDPGTDDLVERPTQVGDVLDRELVHLEVGDPVSFRE